MNNAVAEIAGRIKHLEDEMEAEISRRRAALSADFEDRRIRFEKEVLEAQKRLKQGLLAYFRETSLPVVLTAPIVYTGLVPLLLLDIFLTVYQTTCFPIYGIARVKRRDCFIFDRAHLGYLNAIEKLNCVYCSYGSGVATYFREVIGRTEQYWCPIKHARRALHAHPYYHGFTDFGDAAAYRSELEKLRQELQRIGSRRPR